MQPLHGDETNDRKYVFYVRSDFEKNAFSRFLNDTSKVVSKGLVLHTSKRVNNFALVSHLIFYHLLAIICFIAAVNQTFMAVAYMVCR